MPLNEKGKKIKKAMEKEYGREKGKQVFYASENRRTIKGVKKHESVVKKVDKKLKNIYGR